MSDKKVAVILSGCGVYDGSEIYEASLVLLALDKAGIQYQCMAPNIQQMHVINHLTGEEMPESRNVLVESARLARGDIIDIADASASDYHGLIFPGGFGAAKNLSNFAVAGSEMTVNEEVASFAQSIHQQNKVIGLVCIAPAMAPKIIGEGVKCTIGADAETSAAISAMGGVHQNCEVDSCVIDEENKVVTTPAYMLATRISEAAAGIEKLVSAVIERL
jgi:enhancing lycopene biosynthesis protein 2